MDDDGDGDGDVDVDATRCGYCDSRSPRHQANVICGDGF